MQKIVVHLSGFRNCRTPYVSLNGILQTARHSFSSSSDYIKITREKTFFLYRRKMLRHTPHNE